MLDYEEPDYISDDQPPKELSETMSSLKSMLGILRSSEEEDIYVDQCSFSFTNFENKKQVTLGKHNPQRKHLSVCKGLNLKGICKNPKCVAFQNKSWIKKGYGHFDIGKERFKNPCASCGVVIGGSTVKTVGFRSATIHVEGITNDDVQISKTFTEEKGKLIYFLDSDQDIDTWGYLHITVNKL